MGFQRVDEALTPWRRRKEFTSAAHRNAAGPSLSTAPNGRMPRKVKGESLRLAIKLRLLTDASCISGSQ